MDFLTYYENIKDQNIWEGRIDDADDRDSYRWHQVVQCIDPSELESRVCGPSELGICFIGFCCDAGVQMNLGRTGASRGPEAVRKQLGNLPFPFDEKVRIYDAGNIVCSRNSHLQEAQMALASLICLVKNAGLFPIILGGGHEVAYGSYHGIKAFLTKGIPEGEYPDIGIINFDAHFDMRPYHESTNSGTMFKQIADECIAAGKKFNYMVLGIQKYGNTRSLFTQADELGVNYILGEDIKNSEILEILNKTNGFIRNKDSIQLTICTDVFSSAFAPGVSAPQPFGIDPKVSLGILKNIIKSGKIESIDIAEVSPRFDEDNITSKLVSILIFEMLTSLVKVFRDEV